MAGAVSLQNTTMNPNIILDTSQEYPKFAVLPKMADAPNFGNTANPQVGSSLVSKSSSNQVGS